MFYISSTYKQEVFYFTLLMFVISMLVLTVSNSLLLVFLGWEGLGVTSFLLVIFYQNWLSGKGGLLTLLTNRLGDGVLLITFCILLRGTCRELLGLRGGVSAVLLIILAFTKRAQWPFSSWLPAAIAAPTPVRALVHSSTLVTAGVWLLIRFGVFLYFNTFLVGITGLLTLIMASLAAILEPDAKKIVALSTLSQLGLIFLALARRNKSVCFVHIITHAIAKANLFIIVGRLLHSRFGQQDARNVFSMNFIKFLTITSLMSLFRLMGLTFIAVFYSKELILTWGYWKLNRWLGGFRIILISRLTASYCIKLYYSLLIVNNIRNTQRYFLRISQLIPILTLRIIRLLTGLRIIINISPCSFILLTLEGYYWIILSLGVFFLLFLLKKKTQPILTGFFKHSKFIDLFLGAGKIIKEISMRIEASITERLILTRRASISLLVKQRVRVIVIIALLSIITIFL